MKKMLLLCPKFMGYDEILMDYFKTFYEVKFINTEKYLEQARKRYKKIPIFCRIFLKYLKRVRNIVREVLLSKTDFEFLKEIDEIQNFDTILAINGDGISNKIYKKLSQSCPNAKKYLYIWDDYSLLFRNNYINFFDYISSYNIADCKKFNFKYQPVFTKNNDEIINYKKIYDISIIASANKERIKIAKLLYEKYKEKYNFYIYFYSKNMKFDFFCYDKPLNYGEYQKIMAQSISILDCGRYNQKGPTTRVFDAIVTKTKVITNNKNISQYPVFGPNILIIDNKYEIPENFIRSNYTDQNLTVITVDSWFKNITNT